MFDAGQKGFGQTSTGSLGSSGSSTITTSSSFDKPLFAQALPTGGENFGSATSVTDFGAFSWQSWNKAINNKEQRTALTLKTLRKNMSEFRADELTESASGLEQSTTQNSLFGQTNRFGQTAQSGGPLFSEKFAYGATATTSAGEETPVAKYSMKDYKRKSAAEFFNEDCQDNRNSSKARLFEEWFETYSASSQPLSTASQPWSGLLKASQLATATPTTEGQSKRMKRDGEVQEDVEELPQNGKEQTPSAVDFAALVQRVKNLEDANAELKLKLNQMQINSTPSPPRNRTSPADCRDKTGLSELLSAAFQLGRLSVSGSCSKLSLGDEHLLGMNQRENIVPTQIPEKEQYTFLGKPLENVTPLLEILEKQASIATQQQLPSGNENGGCQLSG